MTLLTLRREGNPLAQATNQLAILEQKQRFSLPTFDQKLNECGFAPLKAARVTTLQINVGKLCNQTCRHCHVDAGPDRREIMKRETMEECLAVLRRTSVETVDVTGGAPELNPHFRWFVGQCRNLGRRVIDRCNLTILIA